MNAGVYRTNIAKKETLIKWINMKRFFLPKILKTEE